MTMKGGADMPAVLYTASTFSHIASFHLPYLRRFHELGWRVEAACGGETREIPWADAVTALPLAKKMTAPENFRAAARLRQMMGRYDLVIAHTSLAAFFTRWAAKGLKDRPKIINVAHGYLFDDDTPAARKLILTQAERMTAPQTDLLLTMNHWDTQWARTHHAARRIAEIPGMGVALDRLTVPAGTRQAMRQRLGLSAEDVALIYPAEFSGRKNQGMLLRAMEALPGTIRLILPGRGALLEDCRRLAAELGVAERVIFPEFVSNIPDWLAASDIAVSASRSEGLPFNVMEAMAAGLPVAATAVKGHTDLVTEGENGCLFPYDDAGAFAAAVTRLAASPELRRRMGRAGQERVKDFSLETVLPQVMERYLSVMETGKTE